MGHPKHDRCEGRGQGPQKTGQLRGSRPRATNYRKVSPTELCSVFLGDKAAAEILQNGASLLPVLYSWIPLALFPEGHSASLSRPRTDSAQGLGEQLGRGRSILWGVCASARKCPPNGLGVVYKGYI